MAKTTVVLMNDDLDGGEADESLSFAFEGTGYEIDLNTGMRTSCARRSRRTSTRPVRPVGLTAVAGAALGRVDTATALTLPPCARGRLPTGLRSTVGGVSRRLSSIGTGLRATRELR